MVVSVSFYPRRSGDFLGAVTAPAAGIAQALDDKVIKLIYKDRTTSTLTCTASILASVNTAFESQRAHYTE